MYPLVETIKIKQRRIQNSFYHNERFNRTRLELFGIRNTIQLEEEIVIPDSVSDNSIFKCRVIYREFIEDIQFEPYKIKEIRTLKIVRLETIDYTYKSTNRDMLNEAYKCRGTCDDIIIIKNGKLTDSYSSNIILRKGDTWYTPDTPLLKGTMRQKLLVENKIVDCTILESDLSDFESIKLINAFREPDLIPAIDIKTDVN